MSLENSIAIIGMHGRFPKSHCLKSFWENLKTGKELISFFSDDELQLFKDSFDKSSHYVKAKGFLADADCFDASFFGYTPREAEMMDPQHRILLECAWHAMEQAGYDPCQTAKKIGVFAGSSVSTYLMFHVLPYLMQNDWQNPYNQSIAMTGNDKDFITTRISYKLNLTGPSQTIQTACSTSLVAIHTACQNLLDFSCDMALAGGVSITCPLKSGYVFFKEGINSPDGHCRAFDIAAEGTLIGNGAGLVVLKRLEDAIMDRDQIHAVILGSAVNNDGNRKLGYTTPSIEGQSDVISEAIAMAGIDPETISYVEAHGTGTRIGDPVEVKALTRAFRTWTEKKQFCSIGSVKTNIGHLDAAAGVAGLIKVILSMKHNLLPPTLHYSSPNPELHLEKTPFYVNDCLREWKTHHFPLRAGISSFGIGGTNSHLILEEAPKKKQVTETEKNEYLLTLSAHTSQALRKIKENFIQYLHEKIEPLGDIAFTLNTGRKQHLYRSFITCKNHTEAIEKISSLLDENVSSIPSSPKPLIWIFPDYEAQSVFSLDLLKETYPTIKNGIECCLEIFKDIEGYDPTIIRHPAIIHFAIQYSFSLLLQSLGNTPDQMLGIGMGQYVAAIIADVMTLQEAAFLMISKLKRDSLNHRFATIQLSKPKISLLSPINFSPIPDESVSEIDYWLTQPSEIFNPSSLSLLSGESYLVFIQSQKLPIHFPFHRDAEYLFLHPKNSEENTLLKALGQLWKKGYIHQWRPLYEKCHYGRTILPLYPFEKVRYWLDSSLFSSQKETIASTQQESISSSIEQNSLTTHPSLKEKLLSIWKETFQMPDIDIETNFFEIGGDSLIAIEIKHAILSHFYIDVPLRTFFDKTTVKEMADFITDLLIENLEKLDEEQTNTILLYLEK